MSQPLQQKLTIKEQIFVDSYLGDANFNASEAARMANYSARSVGAIGNETLQKPKIQEYIAKKVQDKLNKLDITFEWKVKKLKEVAEVSLVGDANGKIYPAAAVSAISELNKMQGDHAPVKTANLNVNVDSSLEDVYELIKLYQKEY